MTSTVNVVPMRGDNDALTARTPTVPVTGVSDGTGVNVFDGTGVNVGVAVRVAVAVGVRVGVLLGSGVNVASPGGLMTVLLLGAALLLAVRWAQRA